MFLSLGGIIGIIVGGGVGSSVVDFLSGDLRIKNLPNLPQKIHCSSMVAQNCTIILCGGFGNEKKCLQLDHGTWKEHSTLNQARVAHSIVTTQEAMFIFGGIYSRTTYEYLPKDSTEWIMGKTEIPGGFRIGCAIAVKSDQEIWLIGGQGTEKRILSFDVVSHTFQVVPFQLNVGRYGHRCAFIPKTSKIMITGGYNDDALDSTEILNTDDGSVTTGSPMNSKRDGHGMSIVNINGKDRIAVFGGYDGRTWHDSVEFYNTETEKWETTDLKLNEAKCSFGFLKIKLGDILCQL